MNDSKKPQEQLTEEQLQQVNGGTFCGPLNAVPVTTEKEGYTK